ncbi:MAG: 1-acyl-sn-glycerol-3-phosphate acyltransferase [Actinobacteria bacterium]|nr:1-acyl-sn-glycerol-3-phosphate acyltransferase [Actinomycetota bacterium]
MLKPSHDGQVSAASADRVGRVWYQTLRVLLAWPVTRLWWPRVRGRRSVPAHGGAVLVSNHVSFSDSIFLPVELRRKVTFLAKQEYFVRPGVIGAFSRWFFTAVGQVPIDRSGGRAAEAAISTGIRVVREGGLLGIYPEGTRSPDGRLYKGRTGAARIAIEAQVPVIPVAMINTFWVQPTGQVLPRLGRRIGIVFGRPIDTSAWQGRAHDPSAMREVTELMMAQLRELGGQEYVDIYATKAKELIAQGVDPAAWAASRADNPEA